MWEDVGCLESATLTGRSTARAAIAASTDAERGTNLDPNPPPTYSATTWTASIGRSNSPANLLATRYGPWVESYSVSVSPSQAAMVAGGSIGLPCSGGVV